MKWNLIEKNGYPKKEGFYAVKYRVFHADDQKWAPWDIAIWNGEGFNHIGLGRGRKVIAWILLWSDE